MTTHHDAAPQPLLERMTWPEARRAAQDGGRVVLLPVGAIEQHGPHLPIDVDNRIVVWLCNEAAKRRPDLIVSAPPIHYGFNEHNMGFPGTITVAIEHFINYVFDVCNSFVRQGHTRIVLFNGLELNQLRGRLIGLLIVNVAAYRAPSRTSPVDGVDLNRTFRGTVLGAAVDPSTTDSQHSLSYRLAHHIFATFVEPCDLLVDLHSGGIKIVAGSRQWRDQDSGGTKLIHLPMVGWYAGDRRAEQLARNGVAVRVWTRRG